MKRIFIMVLLFAAAAAVFANGNAEKLTTLEGTIVTVPAEGGGTRTMLRTAEGLVVIDMPAREMLALRLEENARIRLSGVFVGAPSGVQAQARILARTVAANGTEYTVEKPVGVTERDREQIRAYEAEQLKLQTRLQTQDQTKTQDQIQARDGTGTGDSSGKK